MTVLDIIILIILALGAIIGWKRGIVTQAISLVSTYLVIIVAFLFKGPLALFLCKILPFFSFKGAFAGITVLNILVYEAIAFFILIGILLTAVQLLLFVSKIIDKLIKMTIILTIPSKLIGLVLGVLEYYLFVYIILFIISISSCFNLNISTESKLGKGILEYTPILNIYGDKIVEAGEEIIGLKDKYKESNDKEKFNLEALDVLLKYKITTTESVEKLIKLEKLKMDNVDTVISKYKNN